MIKGSRIAKWTGGALVATGLGTALVNFTGPLEGLRLVAYQDVVGVWTACYGETGGIKRGMRFTREQCDSMFIGSLTEHEAGMRKCLAAPDRIPDKSYLSFVSVTYNIGVGGFCGSTMAKRLNAGNLAGACDAMMMWVKGGKPLRTIKGLVNRREKERTLCLEGVREAAVTVPAPAPQPVPAPAPVPPSAEPEGVVPEQGAPWWVFGGLAGLMAAGIAAMLFRRRG